MATAFQCDKCKKFFSGSPPQILGIARVERDGIVWHVGDDEIPHIRAGGRVHQPELCEHCSLDLLEGWATGIRARTAASRETTAAKLESEMAANPSGQDDGAV